MEVIKVPTLGEARSFIRYNVRSMYPDGPVSWEYQAAENGQWLEADSALDYIARLEEQVRALQDRQIQQ